MINGMTGYGTSAFSGGGARGVIEVKSVNHRYLDQVFFLPVGFGSLESRMRARVGKQIQRGRVTISLKILEKPGADIVFNHSAVREYLRHARSLKKEFGLSDQLALGDLIRLPGVVESREHLLDPDDLWPAIERGLNRAVRDIVSMRSREGRTLARDANDLLRRMRQQIARIQSRAKAVLSAKKKVATNEEFASFQKSCDVNEELIRLRHYIDEFRGLLRTRGPVGKKLDFVAQEMQRETNTTGSKLQDKVVANAVIALKSKVEKLREQAQNIE